MMKELTVLVLCFLFTTLYSQTATYKSCKYKSAKRNNDAIFQGGKKRKKYFEGWYFKLVSAEDVFSIIPGIALGRGNESHAFIQLIEGKTGETHYYGFPTHAFRYDPEHFQVWIHDNYFSMTSVQVDFGQGANERFTASLRLIDPAKLPGKGIMGPFRFVPFMECNHGLISMDHTIEGTASWQGREIDYNGGRGYTEKDWGHSFPKNWIWMQSNNFAEQGNSFMCSIATIPWLGGSFAGFLGFIRINGKAYRFATYTRAKVKDLSVDGEWVSFTIEQKKSFRIEVKAKRSRTGVLQAPVAGSMDRRIAESVDAEIAIKFFNNDGELLYEGTGKHAGLEVVGDPKRLSKK